MIRHLFKINVKAKQAHSECEACILQQCSLQWPLHFLYEGINYPDAPLPFPVHRCNTFKRAALYMQLMNESLHFSHPLTPWVQMWALSIWSKEWNIFPIRIKAVKYVPLSFPFSLQSSFEFWDPLQFCSTLDVTMMADQWQLLQKALIQMDHFSPFTSISCICLLLLNLHFQTVCAIFSFSQGYMSFHAGSD